MYINHSITQERTKIFGRKWRVEIVYSLRNGPLRFSQIKANLPGCSVKVLSESLQDLEQHRIIIRTQYNTIPVKVTYKLAEHTAPLISAIGIYLAFMKNHIELNKDLYNVPAELGQEVGNL